MSLITSCPACGTMFRVVPDQLKISEGWVRCGHCSEVFDATAHLTDESILVEPATAQSAPRPTGAAAARPAATAPQEPAAPPPAATAPEHPRPPEPQEEVERQGLDSASLEPSPLDSPFVFRPSDLARGGGNGDSSLLPPYGADSSLNFAEELADEPTPAELQNVSFVRQARRKAFWRRPTVRILLALLGLALGALLVLQLAYRDRDRLALAQPALKPALQQMCEALHCTLGAPRQIEAIVIDSSGFNRLRNDTYRLAFTLRNTGPVAVATPSMELTITDVQDQVVARRVIAPAELGAADAIPAASEWARSVGIALDAGGSARVAGYRLLAFYP